MRRHVKEDQNRKQRGFTLIELLVVTAILGILAAVVVFSVGGIIARGQNSACKAEVSTVRTAVEADFVKTGAYPPGDGWVNLNADIGPTNANRFLDSDLTATSPSIAAGYDYTAATGTFAGGTCPA